MEVELLQEVISKISLYNSIVWFLLATISLVTRKSFYSAIFTYYFPISMLISVFDTNLPGETLKLSSIIFYGIQIATSCFSYIINFIKKNRYAIVRYCIPHLLSILFVFACLYSLIEGLNPNSFSNISSDSLTRSIDFLYFSITLFAAGGLGDIVPLTLQAKLFVMLEILVAFTMIVLVVIFAREKKETVKKVNLPKRGDWLRYRR